MRRNPATPWGSMSARAAVGALGRHGLFVVLLAVAVLLHFNYIMNHVYVHGTGMADVGWFIHILSSSLEYPPENPVPEIGFGDSYFATHFSPFLYLTSLVYQAIEVWVSRPAYFAGFMALGYGVAGLAVYLAAPLDGARGFAHLWVPGVAFLAVFNGPFLGAVGFPHYEILIPGLILLVVVLHWRGHTWAAATAFVFLLLLREDAGLHAATLYFVVVALHFVQTREIARGLLAYALLGTLYSVLALLVQGVFFPGDNAFLRIFAGEPFFGHLTPGFVFDRLVYLAVHRDYIWVPLLVALILALVSRNVLYLAGALALVPWAVLCLLAVSPMVHTLSNYYAFPFVVSTLWPVVLGFWLTRGGVNTGAIRPAAQRGLAILALAFSVVLFSGPDHADDAPWRSMHFAYLDLAAPTDRAVEDLCREKPGFGQTLVDESGAALLSSCLEEGEWGFFNRFAPEQRRNADAVVFYNTPNPINGPSARVFLEIMEQSNISDLYAVAGTHFIIGADERPEGVANLVTVDGDTALRAPR